MIIAILKYIKDLSEVEKHLIGHREYLYKNYSNGNFIASGPQNPCVGGIILMTVSKQAAYTLIQEDPFLVNDIAEYELIEFSPTKYQNGFEKFIK